MCNTWLWSLQRFAADLYVHDVALTLFLRVPYVHLVTLWRVTLRKITHGH